MAFSAKFGYALILLLVCRASAAPLSASNNADPICTSAQLVAPGQGVLVYKYKTEVKMSVANSQYDLKSEISADVNIKSLGACNYAVQLRNVKVVETKDEQDQTVKPTGNNQRDLENLVVRFRWADGFILAVEADKSARVDHVNFVKGVLSALQVYSPVPSDKENVVREEDVLGVCTTRYKYSQNGANVQVTKSKDLSTCSKDKLHLSSSPVLTSLLGPLVEEAFAVKTHYVCQTNVQNKKVQSVKCKTVEIDTESEKKSSKKSSKDADEHVHGEDSSSEEELDDVNFDDKDEEISSKLIAIRQELTLQAGASANVDGNAVSNPVRQTLQFVPTASFDKSSQTVNDVVKKIEGLLKSSNWDQLAAARFLEVANELRRMDKANLEAFKNNAGLKTLVPTFLNTIYAHDPSAALLNLDSNTLKFANPMSVFYLDNPSEDLANQVIQGARRLNAEQVQDFVGPAAAILKAYKAREENHDAAEKKIEEFQRSISRFLTAKTEVATAVLSAYAQLGLYDAQVQALAAKDASPLPVQYHALNVIRHIAEDSVKENEQLKVRTDLQNLLLRKLRNTKNSNAVRVWSFEALFTSFIYNPETDQSPLADELEKALSDLLKEPLNQVNGFIWSALKYSALDRLCPLRGLAARLRAHHPNKNQFINQPTLSSRKIELEVPLRKNYEAVIKVCLVFENDRVVPSFIGAQLAFDGIRRETLRLPWFDLALINENIDENVAEYFLKLDPLNTNKDVDDDYRTKTKGALPPGPKRLQEAYEKANEAGEDDDSSSVHVYWKLFGADIRASEITDKVQDILKSNVRTYLRNRILNLLKDLPGKSPLFRLPLEIGAASAAANGLTLYKSAQLGLLADLKWDYKNTRDEKDLGQYSMTSRSALSFSFTFQREVASPLTTVGELVHFGAVSNVPFEYNTEATNQGRIREFNLLNTDSTAISTDFEYSVRTSQGFENVENTKGAKVEPSCTPSFVYRGLGLKACLELNPFRSIVLGSRPTYPITVTLHKEAAIKKWRIGWRFNAQDAPQYEVAVEKVGATATYPGLGLSATKTGNNFNIKVLTGMKSFTVKGTQSGDQFTGSVYSDDNKEVMKTSGTLAVNTNGFKLNTKLVDSASKKEVATLTGEIQPNRGEGLTGDIALSTPDKSKSFKVHFRGNLYKEDSTLLHIGGDVNLGGTTYNGKAHFERSDKLTKIEFHRSMKLGKSGATSGYDAFYERKKTSSAAENVTHIAGHITMRTPGRDDATKMLNLKADFTRSNDLSDATLTSALDFLILTRSPPVQEQIQLDYKRHSVRTGNQARRLVSPEANLKVEVKTKSKLFNFLLDHKHRRSAEASKKGPESLPPTLDIKNKLHIAVDTDNLLPDLPRPVAFDVSSDLDFELLNKVNYALQYNLRRRQQAGSLTYKSQVNKVTDGHLFSGTSNSEVLWDNKQKKATATGQFTICTKRRTLETHWDIDTNLVPDKNDMQLDLKFRFDRQPTAGSPRSLIAAYNVTVNAPKHDLFQYVDLDGNFTRQDGFLETHNAIAYRVDDGLKEFIVNLFVDRNQTGDGSLQTHLALSLPFKYLPYITHDLIVQRTTPNGRVSHLGSQLVAKPVLAHYAHVDIDRSNADQPPHVHVDNEVEYLRGNGDSLYAMSKVDVHRWSTLHSFGLLKRNTDLLHKHSIGYVFSNKTRKVALSLESPQLGGNPLSLIGELTIDRENRIGKMKWPQEFGVHLEFGTPLSNLTALHVSYNLPLFSQDDQQTVDASVGFKLASPKITPISLYLQSEGSLSTKLHFTGAVNVGDDIATSALLTAQYHPEEVSQVSLSTSGKYYQDEFQNSLYALYKNHQVIVRGIMNTTENEDIQYELDIGFDQNLLTGHSERSNGPQVVSSDINAKHCSPSGKFRNCYKGDITVRSNSNNGAGRKGSFDVSWGRGTAKLDVSVPNGIEIKFDHTHTGRLRDEDFKSETNINGKLLQSDNRAGFSYSGSVEKENGRWNDVSFQTSALDKKTGQKSFGTDISLKQSVKDKRTGQFHRQIKVNFQRRGTSILNWSSDSDSCSNNPAEVLYGICQKGKFTATLNNQFAKRIRQRLQLPDDPKLSNPAEQVSYDGTFDLDVKSDPQSGPHELKVDVNRLKEDAVDLAVKFQPRHDDKPMNLRLTANLPRQTPISVQYDEKRNSATNFQGTLKYSLNSKDASAEKTFQCDVDRPDPTDVAVTCKGDRTTLTIDFDRKAGKSKAYVDLNNFKGQRVGFDGSRNPQTQELDATLYTFVSAWNLKRKPGRSITLTVQQEKKEVLSIEGTKVGEQQFQVRFSPSNVQLQLNWDNSTVVTLKQTAPQARNLLSLTIDREQIRPYLPSLRNQNRPAHDIHESKSKSSKALVELTLDTHVVLSLSQALDKLGAHNGLYGLDTVKKAFRLQLGDALVTVYNTQHWKTHRENSQLPESYSLRVVNDANGNFVQLTTNRWNENRLISKISHSFDGGKSQVTDLKVDRDYAHKVGSVFFLQSFGYRNIQGAKQLRNFTRSFLRQNLRRDLTDTNLGQLAKDLRKRLRTIIEEDYSAVKAIATAWSKEPENSFLRRFSARLQLLDFFAKYPTYAQASDRLSTVLLERGKEREEFWRDRFESILNENRLKGLAERFQARRTALMKRLSEQATKLLDRYVPKVDQANIDRRIADYVNKLIGGFEQVLKRNSEQMKATFKALDEASKGDDLKWFRTLVADIDSAAFASTADAEVSRVVKKLGDSSKLLINNIQQLSKRLTKRQENIRARVQNAIRHLPNGYINETNFHLSIPLGRRPGSYTGFNELLLAAGSLLRNRDQAFDTVRSILTNHLDSRTETMNNYYKAGRALVKRLFRRNPSLTPEYKAIITPNGDGLDFHGHYIYLNPACNHLLAQDFADLQFAFVYIQGKVYSVIPSSTEVKDYECSSTGRVQACNQVSYSTINLPMYYGGRVNGTLGDVRDHSGKASGDLATWHLRACSTAAPKSAPSVPECANVNPEYKKFCDNYVQNNLKDGVTKQQLVLQAGEALNQLY